MFISLGVMCDSWICIFDFVNILCDFYICKELQSIAMSNFFPLFSCNVTVTDIAKLFRKSADFLPSLNFGEKIFKQRDLQPRTTHIMQTKKQFEVSTAPLLRCIESL